jgi:hypothetical protein
MAAGDNTRMSGINGGIAIGGPLSGGGTLVSAKTQWTYSNQRDFFDGSAFGDTNKQWYAGLQDSQGTYTGLLDLSGDLLFNAAGQTAKLLYLYADSNQGGSSVGLYEVAHGSGFLDATVDCSLNDMVKINGAFRASANWTRFSVYTAP